jgi:flagellar hook-associated protein 1 FlgK
MPSTFFGLNIGASGLSAFQTSVTTTANNVSNTKTKGYTRQTATLQSTDAIRVAAKYGSVGTGVEVTSITQERNLFYDMKYWEANSKQGLYDKKLYYAEQV